MTAQFESIYNEFDKRLQAFILQRVSDTDSAEDILQEVYIKIHDRIDSLRDTDKLQGWIYQITRNAIIDHYRRRKPDVELPDELSLPEQEEADTAGQLTPSLRMMIGCLKEKYREALLLTEYQGLTQQELADQLGISLSGAKSRVQRAREQLKNTLLDCCHFEFDRFGKIINYHPRCEACASDDYLRDCASDEEALGGYDLP